MSQLKYYNALTSTWEPVVIGAQGPQGETGPTGPQGPQGAVGTNAAPAYLPIQSGRYYRTPYALSTRSNAGDTYLMGSPLYIATTTTFDRIGATTVAVTTAGTLRVGIYSDPGNTGAPTDLVLDAGVISYTAGNTAYEITINQTLNPGWYWLCNVNQSGVATWRGYTSYTQPVPTQSLTGNNNTSFVGNFYMGSSVSGALPSTISGAYPQGYDMISTFVRSL